MYRYLVNVVIMSLFQACVGETQCTCNPDLFPWCPRILWSLRVTLSLNSRIVQVFTLWARRNFLACFSFLPPAAFCASAGWYNFPGPLPMTCWAMGLSAFPCTLHPTCDAPCLGSPVLFHPQRTLKWGSGCQLLLLRAQRYTGRVEHIAVNQTREKQSIRNHSTEVHVCFLYGFVHSVCSASLAIPPLSGHFKVLFPPSPKLKESNPKSLIFSR